MLEKIPVKCLTKNCNIIITKHKMKDHWKNECKINCIVCKDKISVLLIKEHIDNLCPDILILCNYCFSSFARKNINQHTEKDCPKYPITCINCNENILRENLDKHLLLECPKIERNCKGLVFGCIYKDNLPNLTNHELICPYVILLPMLKKKQDEINSLNEKIYNFKLCYLCSLQNKNI
jgi:hypothetical protein